MPFNKILNIIVDIYLDLNVFAHIQIELSFCVTKSETTR